MASARQEFAEYVVEQMAQFGPVRARRMFGGFGLYHDGLMFALIVEERLYFKADAQTQDDFVQRGLRPFTYTAKGRAVALRYFEAPPDVFDEPDCMADWARSAYACARRSSAAAASRSRHAAGRTS
ncbi:MAG: transcriptional regulator [Moraxellaceae bacterium]|nr:transcriptional regulator [Moraxellaceae bacterium]